MFCRTRRLLGVVRASISVCSMPKASRQRLARFSVDFNGVEGRPSCLDLFGRERDTHHFEPQVGKEQIMEGLQLARDGYRHLVPGRIAVAQGEQYQRPAVLIRLLGDLIDQRVTNLAGRQIQVGLELARDRQYHVFE